MKVGYMIKDRILRPASVGIIVKPPEESSKNDEKAKTKETEKIEETIRESNNQDASK